MAAKSRQKVRVAVEIEPEWFVRATPTRAPMVRMDIWKTAMRLTGSSLKGMEVCTHTCVSFPVESLTSEGRAELEQLGLSLYPQQ
jgi:hypothetical protein